MTERNGAVPPDRCGFELQPDDVGFDGSHSWLVKEINPVCCWRPVWESHDETDRCIWHADVDEKPLAELIAARTDSPERLDGAILRNLQIEGEELSLDDCPLRGARFDHSRLQDSDFTDADLRWADFTGANLTRADFTDTYLQQANFTDAYLQEADFSHADARWASFRHATLQDAVFTHTDCRETTFTSALLYEAVFSDTRINSQTTFFDPTTFYESITSHPGCVYEENPLTTNPRSERAHMPDHLPRDVQPLEAARWMYRRLETLHEDNALSEAAREFHISKEEAERALYWERGEYGPWSVKTLMWYLTIHGESVKRVLMWWGGVILTAGVLFSIGGGVTDSDGPPYVITSPSELGTIAGWQDILWNIYFSITTFSTIMDGGLAPAGTGTRAVVAIESITGALLVALLVFVLGQRVAR